MPWLSTRWVLVQIPWDDYPSTVAFRFTSTNLRYTAVDHSILISSHIFLLDVLTRCSAP